jgi:hypothetical protein
VSLPIAIKPKGRIDDPALFYSLRKAPAANVVPAKAGTHNHSHVLLASMGLQSTQNDPPGAMGPCFCRDDDLFFTPQPYAAACFFGGNLP